MTEEQARKIVEGILNFVDVAGRFDGRRAQRKLLLQDIVNKQTGQITHAMDHLVAWVREQA